MSSKPPGGDSAATRAVADPSDVEAELCNLRSELKLANANHAQELRSIRETADKIIAEANAATAAVKANLDETKTAAKELDAQLKKTTANIATRDKSIATLTGKLATAEKAKREAETAEGKAIIERDAAQTARNNMAGELDEAKATVVSLRKQLQPQADERLLPLAQTGNGGSPKPSQVRWAADDKLEIQEDEKRLQRHDFLQMALLALSCVNAIIFFLAALQDLCGTDHVESFARWVPFATGLLTMVITFRYIKLSEVGIDHHAVKSSTLSCIMLGGLLVLGIVEATSAELLVSPVKVIRHIAQKNESFDITSTAIDREAIEEAVTAVSSHQDIPGAQIGAIVDHTLTQLSVFAAFLFSVWPKRDESRPWRVPYNVRRVAPNILAVVALVVRALANWKHEKGEGQVDAAFLHSAWNTATAAAVGTVLLLDMKRASLPDKPSLDVNTIDSDPASASSASPQTQSSQETLLKREEEEGMSLSTSATCSKPWPHWMLMGGVWAIVGFTFVVHLVNGVRFTEPNVKLVNTHLIAMAWFDNAVSPDFESTVFREYGKPIPRYTIALLAAVMFAVTVILRSVNFEMSSLRKRILHECGQYIDNLPKCKCNLRECIGAIPDDLLSLLVLWLTAAGFGVWTVSTTGGQFWQYLLNDLVVIPTLMLLLRSHPTPREKDQAAKNALGWARALEVFAIFVLVGTAIVFQFAGTVVFHDNAWYYLMQFRLLVVAEFGIATWHTKAHDSERHHTATSRNADAHNFENPQNGGRKE